MSDSLIRLDSGLTEVRALLAANPAPGPSFPRLDVIRAIGRSAVVLTVSHLEAYLHNLTEEAVLFLAESCESGIDVPLRLRLRHSARPLEDAAKKGWEHRETILIQLFDIERALWTSGVSMAQPLDHERLLGALKTPRSKPLIRYFRDWGIDDIFTEITRKPTTRKEMYLRIDELGEKRNLIAHGDLNAQATAGDVKRYVEAVSAFCRRVDRVMSRRLERICGDRPW